MSASPTRLSDSVEDAKAQLRSRVRATRLERSQRRRDDAAAALAEHVLALPQVQAATCVSVYASRPHEPGTLPLIEALHERGVRVLLPLLGDGLQRGWGDYAGAEDLTERAPGRPPEPSGGFLPSGVLRNAQVIVVPALAVDRAGIRLGQGGGWYDRALADAHADALLVALCYPEELRASDDPLPREKHDVGVHTVVTPLGVTELAA